MLTDQTITFIGSGHMAEAMLAGLLQQQLVTAAQVTATDVQPSRRQHIAHTYGVQVTADNGAAVGAADWIILAIKPQALPTVGATLNGRLHPDAAVLSILAGTPLETLTATLGHQRVVRAMPNTPAQIGLGMTMWCCTTAIAETQRTQAQQLLAAFGRALFTPNEAQLDMATALNGSGPGYIFLMLEAMIDTGVHLGLARSVAEELVLHTALGSVQYAIDSDLHLAELRNRVTSPGGTTAAGLYAMEKEGVRTALAEGIWAAYRRSRELGQP